MEYLFRGKLKDSNNWAYGYLAAQDQIAKDGVLYFIEANTANLWTNLKDSFGHKIFENDILKRDDNTYYQVIYLDGTFYAMKIEDNNIKLPLFYLKDYDVSIEVIGNTYEAA